MATMQDAGSLSTVKRRQAQTMQANLCKAPCRAAATRASEKRLMQRQSLAGVLLRLRDMRTVPFRFSRAVRASSAHARSPPIARATNLPGSCREDDAHEEATCKSYPAPAAAMWLATEEAQAQDAPEDDHNASGRWPFQLIADRLLCDLLDATWEVRHGAALGLRQILSHHAPCAGVSVPVSDPLSGVLVDFEPLFGN